MRANYILTPNSRNKDNLISKIEVFQRNLVILKEAIINDDKESLEGEFRESSRRRTQL